MNGWENKMIVSDRRYRLWNCTSLMSLMSVAVAVAVAVAETTAVFLLLDMPLL